MNSLVSKRLQRIRGSGSLKFAGMSSLLAVLFGLTPLPAIIALVFLLAALTAVLPVKQFGVVTRIFMGIMLLVSLNAVIGLIAWLVNLSLSPGPLSALYAVGLLAVIAMYPEAVKRYAPKNPTSRELKLLH